MISRLIRKLPAPAEFCLVVLACFWWAIYASIRVIASHASSASTQVQQPVTGIGVELGAKDGKIIIVQTVPNSPAASAGLSRGWIVQKVDGISTDGKSPDDCGDMVRGPAGTALKLEVVDPAHDTTNTVALTRAAIQGTTRPHATDRSALTVAIFELFGLAVTFWIARTRRWPLETWGLRPSWKLTGAGVVLFLVMTVAIWAIAASVNALSPAMVHKHSVSDLSLPVVIFFATINAATEEILETGYFIQSLQRYGMWSAVLASALFRTFLHAFHGVTALVIIFPVGLVFGFIYWRWRRLWPLFIAHVLFDVFAFFPA
jgi:membrane protease YdiL (CAAX protease family)